MLLGACNASRAGEPTIPPLHASLPERGAIIDYGYQIDRAQFHYGEDGYVEAVEVWHGDSTYRYLSILAAPSPSATPTATHTPAPTATLIPTNTPRPAATAVPTLGPSPTRTPWPTITPIPTDNFPLPTHEATVLPTQPPEPTIIPKVCRLQASKGINIRDGASLTATPIGSWALGSYRVFDKFSPTPKGYMWGHSSQSPAGWSVVYDDATFEWWVYGTAEAGECYTVPDWPPNLMPPAPIARAACLLAFHLIVGSNNTFIALGDGKVCGAKGTTHTQPLLDLLKAVNPNAVTIYRSLHNSNGMIDGPLAWEWYNPDAYYDKARPYAEIGRYDYVEYMNEWGLPRLPDGSEDWPQWERFTIRMLERFTADGQCALFGSFGPGAPDIPGWPYIVDVMQWSDAHPCAPGRYHGWATHTTLPMPDWVTINPASYIRNPWIIERDLIFRDWARANRGYNLAAFKGGVYVTEGGWSDYSVVFDRDFSCDEVAAGWRLTVADYTARRPWVRLIALWTLTRDGDPSWYNLQSCLSLLFNTP